jgi:thiamine kinase-like enzyme
MTNVLTDIEQLTPLWLTRLLQKNGILQKAEVAEIYQTKSNQTNISFVSHLAVRYTVEEPSAPMKLFLKIPNPDFNWGDREIKFYNEIVPVMLDSYDWAALPFLHCYDAAYSTQSGRSHFLFEDVADSYFSVDGSMPSALQHQESAIDAFAQFHAFWWEHPKLGQEFGEKQTEERISQFINSAQTKLDDFASFRGKRLSETQHAILHAVVSSWPYRRKERLIQGQGITLVHRDPHPLNLLYSHDVGRADVKLIDWQSWRVDTGTDDLAYYIACHWPFEARAEIEHPLIQRYHQQLLHFGVENYTWDDCWYDYRASVIRCLFFLIGAWSPIQWQRGWWWTKVTQGISAFEHLNCIELLME